VPHESVLDSLASAFNPLVPTLGQMRSRHMPKHLLRCSARSATSDPTEWVITGDLGTGNRRITPRHGGSADSRSSPAVRGMGGRQVRRPGPVVVGRRLRPRSGALASFAQRDVSEWVRSTAVANIPGRARRRDPLVEEATASAAGVVLANCGVTDAMVAMLVDVESLSGKLDWLLAAVAQPERQPMPLVAF
jgi:hypothetical protein